MASASTPAVALRVVFALLALPGFFILPTTSAAVSVLIDLLRRYPVTGPGIFDLQIIATMKANNVSRIYTYNAADFRVFPELTVVVPGAGTFQ